MVRQWNGLNWIGFVLVWGRSFGFSMIAIFFAFSFLALNIWLFLIGGDISNVCLRVGRDWGWWAWTGWVRNELNQITINVCYGGWTDNSPVFVVRTCGCPIQGGRKSIGCSVTHRTLTEDSQASIEDIRTSCNFPGTHQQISLEYQNEKFWREWCLGDIPIY